MLTILPAKSYTLKLQYCMKTIFLQNKAIRSIHFDVKWFWISQFIIAASNTGPWRTTNYYHTMCDGQHWSFHSCGWYYTSTTGLFASTAKLHYYYDYIMPHYTHAHAHAHAHTHTHTLLGNMMSSARWEVHNAWSSSSGKDRAMTTVCT